MSDNHPTVPLPTEGGRAQDDTPDQPTLAIETPATYAAPAASETGLPDKTVADDEPVGTDTSTGDDGATAHTATKAPSTLRVGTVVWGFVVVAIGIGVLAISFGAQIDVELAAISLLGLAGVSLLVGAVVAGARRNRRRP
ncbi:hypothetical protein [Oerskovia flava]|uniref:hypothetical protein n=1 Tax=Oerskovia flava TaxID=2986422 RepID=UPI00223F0F64|nr:hypothetical protein [Oerskovia sp. JB1-3-2]